MNNTSIEWAQKILLKQQELDKNREKLIFLSGILIRIEGKTS